jgi:transposase
LTRTRLALVEHHDGLANLLESATGLARKAVQRQRANLQREIQRLEQEIKKLLDREPDSKLSTQVALADSIPGVGLLTAATVLAELPPIDTLEHVNQVIGLFGLDPKSKTSGSSVKTPARISKMGSKRGRRALYMPALVALRYNPLIRALGQRLRAKGRRGKYIVVAAMRKLLRQIFGVVKNGKPFDPQWFNSHATRFGQEVP